MAPLLRTLGLLLVPACAASSMASDVAVLHVDGILRVQHLSLQDARMIIMQRDGGVEVVDQGLAHFQRALALHSNFLIAFERPGCVTKQLLFDTEVPADVVITTSFDFPFQVTLEPPPDGRPFAYAGPVGYVRYYPERGDFGYDTDYSRMADPVLTARMEELMARTSLPTPPLAGPAPAPAPLTNATRTTTPPDTDAFHVLVPTLATKPVLVHPTGLSATTSVTTMDVLPSPAVEPPPLPTPTRPISAPVMAITPPTMERPPTAEVLEVPVADGDARSEELIVEKQRITRIVRITHGGHQDEYRRVEHRWGGVFYFKDGASCSALLFEAGTGGH